MKLSIILIVWAVITAMLIGTCFGITLITWGDVDIVIITGWWIGLWLVFGGLPLYFGTKQLLAKRQISEKTS